MRFSSFVVLKFKYVYIDNTDFNLEGKIDRYL